MIPVGNICDINYNQQHIEYITLSMFKTVTTLSTLSEHQIPNIENFVCCWLIADIIAYHGHNKNEINHHCCTDLYMSFSVALDI